jgi:hypothetical protein
MKPQLVAYDPPDLSTEMGIENLSVKLSPTCSGVILTADNCTAPAIDVPSWTADSWIRNVNLTGFNSFISVASNASRITIQGVGMFRDANSNGDQGWASDITVEGSQILVVDSGQYGLSTARGFAVVTSSTTPGPNAILRHTVQSASLQQIFPHQRWAHGLLVEDTAAPVLFNNRATAGSGQGWTISGAVAWNVQGNVNISSPPLGVNWCIGCTGEKDSHSNGTFIDANQSVVPGSLFAAQLKARGVQLIE